MIGAQPLLVLGAVAAVVALGALIDHRGFARGEAHVRAQIEAANAEARKALNKAETARLELAAERDDLARQLEDEANVSPVVAPACLGVDRVRRLNAYD